MPMHSVAKSFPRTLTNINLVSQNKTENKDVNKVDDFYSNKIKSKILKSSIIEINSIVNLVYKYFIEDNFFFIPLDDFIWAYYTAMSRKFNISGENEVETYLILPLIDMFNLSSPEKSNIILKTNHFGSTDESYVEIFAKKEIAMNSQLFLSYGNSNNLDLLRRYGIADINNPNKNRNIVMTCTKEYNGTFFKDMEGSNGNGGNTGIGTSSAYNSFLNYQRIMVEENRNKKERIYNSIIDKRNKSNLYSARNGNVNNSPKYLSYNNMLNFSGVIYTNRFEKILLEFLRVSFMSNKDIEEYEEKHTSNNSNSNNDEYFTNKISNTNEYSVFNYLKIILEYYNFENTTSSNSSSNVSSFHNISEEIINEPIFENIEEYYTKMVSIYEAEEKQIIEKNIGFVNKYI